MAKTPTAVMKKLKMIISQDDMVSAPFVGPRTTYPLLHPFVCALAQASCQATDVPRPATQVMKSKRVVGENHLTFMAGEETGDEGIPDVIPAAAEMAAVATSLRLSCNPPETTLFPYRFFAGPSLTLATSNRHLLGTVYALCRSCHRCDYETATT